MKLRIKEIAKAKGLLLKDIAAKAGMSETMLSYYNNGKNVMSVDVLDRVAKAMNCEPSELLPVGEKYGHFYIGGEWEGIRKK